MRIRFLLLLGLLAGTAHADPLKSPACAQALSAFQAAREARSDATEAARQSAARACLGLVAPGPQRSNRWAQEPISVAPAEPPTRSPSTTTVMPKPALPAVQIDRPATVTSCDANGCWTSEGTRLPRMGPDLIGPNGVCSVNGAFASCP